MAGGQGRERCAKRNCTASFTPHRWGTMRACKDGWFIQKDGTAWCPQHNPDWVVEWRARRREKSSSSTGAIDCATEGCGAKYIPGFLGGTKEQRAGWLLKNSGQAWCPNHISEEK